MSYFFPQKMTYCQALVSTQIAWDVFNQLGELEKIALQSNIINYQNPFIKSFRRCDQALTRLSNIRSDLEVYRKFMDFNIKQCTDEASLWLQFKHKIQESKMQGYLYINHIEDEIGNSYNFLNGQLKEIENSSKRIGDLVSQMSLLATVANQPSLKFFWGPMENDYRVQEVMDRGKMFQNRCVCVSRKDLMILKRGIFRITRGNSCVYELQINKQELNKYFGLSKHRKLIEQLLKDKLVVFILYQKGERNILLSKLNRLLGCFDCHVLAADINNMREELPRLERKVNELESIEELTLQSIKKHIDKLCEVREGSNVSWLSYMEAYTKKQRQIYRALSTTHVTKNLIKFNLYIPTKQLPLNIQPKQNYPPLILNAKQSHKMPPSKFDTNMMLKIPQQIVNTYGVPSYGQINPAPFYIVTFGFFIGVMFGDVGHMLMAIPLLLHFKANAWFWTVVFFMGYNGLLYNQFFGLNLGIFTSCYDVITNGQTNVAVRADDCVFTFGIDSIWKVSENQMAFTNSLKMKIAVILGVVHMMFGLFLKLLNNIRQKQILDIITLTIPQILFLLCTFVYMDFLIIYKWSSSYSSPTEAPSIISTMISVYVNMAKYKKEDKLFWPEQRSLQQLVIAVAFICVPIMLFGKTLVIYCRRKSNSKYSAHQQIEELAEQQDYIEMQQIDHEKMSQQQIKKHPRLVKKQHSQEQQSIKEIAVHQFIQTIEFVLGSVSNTASYLRLWALSLAHAQLSTVIFQLTVLKMLQGGYSNLIGLFLIFPFFYTTTFGVLICMDSLQCFLHSLRLHWVEFQNKFYQGKGYLFEPFSFRKLK